MSDERMVGTRGLGRTAAVAAALVTIAMLAGNSQAGATLRPGGARSPQAGHPATAGTISTVAGGVGGPGPGTSISLVNDHIPPGLCGSAILPQGVDFGAGHLYIADGVVRQVDMRTGYLTTPAGTGAAGPLGNGGPATRAAFTACGVSVDHAGNQVIADPAGRRLWVAPASTGTFYGRAMTAGHIYVVAGDGGSGPGGSGVPAIRTALNRPLNVAVDAVGNLLIADEGLNYPGTSYGSRIRVVAARTGTFWATSW